LSFYVLLLWIHLLAAIAWIGGMLFLSLVLAPLVRSRKAAPEFIALFRLAARRFRLFVWSAIVLLLSTGPLLVVQRGWSLSDPNDWPLALKVKLSLVAALVILTLSHDLVFGPRMRTLGAIPAEQRSAWDQALVRSSVWLPRLALLVALSVVAVALVLARS
jgi:uncharacterized membrane protein